MCVALIIALIATIIAPTITAFAAKAEVIDQLDLTVTSPMDGEKPKYDKIDGRGYYSDNGLHGTSTRIFKNGIAWYKNTTSYFSPGTTEVFKEDTTYTVKINLLPKGNFEFSENVTARVNGNVATVEACDDGSILVIAILKSPKKDVVISELNLTVPTPVDGAKPDYTKIDGNGYYSDNGMNGVSTKIYKNGIAWFKSTTSYFSPGTTETFVAGTDYTVKISLTAKDGYKFDNTLTAKINGKSATVEAFDDGSINVSVTLSAPQKEQTTTTTAATTQKPTETTTSVVGESTTTVPEDETTATTTPATNNTTVNNADKTDDNGLDMAVILAIAGGAIVVAAVVVVIIIVSKKK